MRMAEIPPAPALPGCRVANALPRRAGGADRRRVADADRPLAVAVAAFGRRRAGLVAECAGLGRRRGCGRARVPAGAGARVRAAPGRARDLEAGRFLTQRSSRLIDAIATCDWTPSHSIHNLRTMEATSTMRMQHGRQRRTPRRTFLDHVRP